MKNVEGEKNEKAPYVFRERRVREKEDKYYLKRMNLQLGYRDAHLLSVTVITVLSYILLQR